MKLAVISDLHLGQKKYRTEVGSINKYENSIYEAWNANIDIILREKPDCLIYCGDIFETANPSIIALGKFKDGLARLKSIPSLIILGNHDFSFTNRQNDCNSIGVVLRSDQNVAAFADYSVQSYEMNDTLFVLAPYIYDTSENIQAIWDECERLSNQNYKHKILVTHGVTDDYVSRFPAMQDKFSVPDSLSKKFDAVFIGHIHTPFEYMIDSTIVISPGALVDYQAYSSATGPLFYDTDTGEYRREVIDTPHIIKKTLYETNINEFLPTVGSYIYNITYVGDVSKIDNSLFIQAKERAINFVINLQETAQPDVKEKSDEIDNFFEWIHEKYPDKEQLFINAKAELN